MTYVAPKLRPLMIDALSAEIEALKAELEAMNKKIHEAYQRGYATGEEEAQGKIEAMKKDYVELQKLVASQGIRLMEYEGIISTCRCNHSTLPRPRRTARPSS